MRKLKVSELNRISIEEFKKTKKTPIIIVLDNIRSLHNIGSIFRTADAFLIEAIYLCGITASPPHREIHKTALGATESVKWKYFSKTIDAITELKKNNYQIIGIEQTEKNILLNKFTIEKNVRYALIFGNEVSGIDENIFELIDYCIEIPQSGTKHSLNVSVSAGVVLWIFYSQINLSNKSGN